MAKRESRTTKILAYIKDHPDCTRSDVRRDVFGLSPATTPNFYGYLNDIFIELLDDGRGKVMKMKERRPRREMTYRITERGLRHLARHGHGECSSLTSQFTNIRRPAMINTAFTRRTAAIYILINVVSHGQNGISQQTLTQGLQKSDCDLVKVVLEDFVAAGAVETDACGKDRKYFCTSLGQRMLDEYSRYCWDAMTQAKPDNYGEIIEAASMIAELDV